MVAISMMVEGQDGVDWPLWQQLAAEVDSLGFAGLFRSDHFTNPAPPDKDSLELVVSLAYLATASRHIHFGPLVAPVSFRDPIMFARQAAALDDLSGGRMVLGLGTGWDPREHGLFGYALGDIPTRVARLEEALAVSRQLLHGDEPVTYEGRFYNLRNAALLPRPRRPGGPPILVGGNGPKRTLPLAARYADIWNGVGLSVEDFRQRCAQLDDLLRAEGRQPGALRRTVARGVVFGLSEDEVNRKLNADPPGDDAEWTGKSFAEKLPALSGNWGALAGTPDMIAEQIKAYGAAGADEMMLWLDPRNVDELRAFAREVLPRL